MPLGAQVLLARGGLGDVGAQRTHSDAIGGLGRLCFTEGLVSSDPGS